MPVIRIAVLISGSGSNMAAIADHLEDRSDIEIGVVIADRPTAAGLSKAAERGLPTAVVDWSAYTDRDSFTRSVCDAVQTSDCQFMVLAGFMRVLAAHAIDVFGGRILNIHPSLLPAFPGAHAVDEALAAGVDETGVTVHIVDELVDHGPIIAQAVVPVHEGDTTTSLQRRIQQTEHRLYPRIIVDFVSGDRVSATEGP
jgi:phosphoribosylglycinamide formyltransferase-1